MQTNHILPVNHEQQVEAHLFENDNHLNLPENDARLNQVAQPILEQNRLTEERTNSIIDRQFTIKEKLGDDLYRCLKLIQQQNVEDIDQIHFDLRTNSLLASVFIQINTLTMQKIGFNMNSVLLLENSFIQLPLSFIHDLDISKEESQYLKDFILNYINLCISIINKNYALPAAEIDTLLSSSLRPQIHSLNYSIIYPQLDLLKQIPSYKNENYIEVVQEILRSDPTLLKHLYLYPLSYFLTEAKCQELGEETLKKLEEDEAIFKEKFIHLLIFVKENFSDRQDVQEMIAYLNKDLEYVLDLRFNKAKKALFQS